MSGAERERFEVLRRVMRGELRQARAAELLGIGVRQVKRLVRSYRCEGEASVVSRRRGRPSNNRLDAAKVATIEATLRTRYADFGATLASEKLREMEGVSVSKERVRQIQIRLGLWRPRPAAHQEDLPGSRTPAALWRTHPDRREPARLVRGPAGALHADRVHRRRHRSVDASAICPAETT